MDDETRAKGPWKKNLYILWVCTFVAGLAFSEIMPFMSLYVASMGHYTKSQVTFYSGLVYAITFLITAIASPIWGALADRKGRKVMIIRAGLGTALSMLLMGLTTSVWQLFACRALQGIFAGFISNSQALVASQTPRNQSGRALGTLVTGSTSGMLLGPIVGGILADVFSIRSTFFITAALLLITTLIAGFFVKEFFVPVEHPKRAKGEKRSFLAGFPNPKLTIVLLCSTMIVQLGNASISPILSLYVRELMHYRGPITIVAGIIAALPGLSNIIAAPRLGRYGDHHGTGKVLTAGYLFAVIMYFPQGFVSSIVILGVLRLMIGVSDAALFPSIQTLLTKSSPITATSAIFSWNQSFQALGNMFGAFLGGALAGLFDYNAVFICTACMLLFNFVLLWFTEPSLRRGQVG